MKILFVCKHNRFRSKIAEAFFNEFNKNKKNVAKSAGIIRGSSLDNRIVSIAKKLKLTIVGKPTELSTDLLRWQDITIVVADNVPPSIFTSSKNYFKKVIVWKIPDTESKNTKRVNEIISQIETKMRNFVDKLE